MLNFNKLKTKKAGPYNVLFRNLDEFKRIYKEIFVDNEYKFNSKKDNPFIIDCGSHIGLSILYFKTIYPKSEILGFEPNPDNYKILCANIKNNNLKNVKVFNYALSDIKGKVDLHASFKKDEPWTWGDTIIYNMWGDGDNDKKIPVKTAKLSTYIRKHVDLIKLDVEGSEQKVVQEIESKLGLVEELTMEYHGTKTSIKVNDYSKIREILIKHGFRVKTYVKSLGIAFPNFVANLRKESSVFTVRANKITN